MLTNSAYFASIILDAWECLPADLLGPKVCVCVCICTPSFQPGHLPRSVSGCIHAVWPLSPIEKLADVRHEDRTIKKECSITSKLKSLS